MKRHLANIITCCRIAAAAWLFGFNELNWGFMALFIFCGVSDVLDGPLARSLGTASPAGARLDTLGDGLTYAALFRVLLRQHLLPPWIAGWLGAALLLQLLAALLGLVLGRGFCFPHTFSSKIMGFSLFVLAFIRDPLRLRPYLLLLGLIFSWSALEALLWQLPGTRLHEGG